MTNQRIEKELKQILKPQVKKHLGVSGTEYALSLCVNGYRGRAFRIDPGIFLYRAVLNRENGERVKFLEKHTDRLMAPPERLAIKGRCGDSGERVLYCCEHPIIALAELRSLRNGDFVTFLTFRVEKEWFPVSFVDALRLSTKHSQFKRFIVDHFSNPNRDPISSAVNTIMGTEFSQRVAEGADYHYNSTIAWKRLCFEHDESKCLIFPSVTSDLQLANLAFDPEYAIQVLRPVEVNRYHMLEVDLIYGRFIMQLEHKATISEYGTYELVPIDSKPETVTYWDTGENPFARPLK